MGIEIILLIALGLGGFTFFVYIKNLAPPKKPSNPTTTTEDEDLLRIKELMNQNEKKNEEVRELENPENKKLHFKEVYKRTNPNRPEVKDEPQPQQNTENTEKMEEQAQQTPPPEPEPEKDISEEILARNSQEELVNKRLEEMKNKFRKGCIYAETKRKEIKERKKT